MNDFSGALDAFWAGRNGQLAAQAAAGKRDAGTRGAVTGGKHLDGLRDMLADMWVGAGVPARAVRTSGCRLPGYYRRAKNWDMVVLDQERRDTARGEMWDTRGVLASLELKSMVGSIGNNLNNRMEEALGNAVDFWAAWDHGLLAKYSDAVRPWLGYVYVLGDQPELYEKGAAANGMLMPIDPHFDAVAYETQLVLFMERLVATGVYSAGWLIVSNADGTHHEPSEALSFSRFSRSLREHVATYLAVGSGRL